MLEYGEFKAHSLAKTVAVWKVQARDDVYDSWKTLHTFRENENPAAESEARSNAHVLRSEHRWTRAVEAREPNPYYGRFFVGQEVKVHPSTSRFMQGFRYGTVTRVAYKYVTVRWSGSSEVSSKFIPEFLAPEIRTYDLM